MDATENNAEANVISSFYEENILLAYQGVFENSLLAVMAKNIRSSVKNINLSKTIFRIFVELSQNISFYSNEKEVSENGMSGSGIIVLKNKKKHFVFAAGNTVEKDTVDKLVKKSKFINTMNKDELREYKRSQFKQKINGKLDAHIGLIQIAILSGNKIDVELKTLPGGEYFVTIGTKINFE